MNSIFFIFLFVAIIVFIYLKSNWRLWGVVMIILLTILIPPHVKFFSFFISTIFSYIITLYCILYLIFNKEKIDKFNKKVYLYLLLIVISYAIIMPFSDRIDVYQQILNHKTTFLMLQLPFIVTIMIRSKEDVIKITKIILIATMLITIYGILCYITQSNPYITMINNIYPDEVVESYDRYRDEARGILQGRISATFLTPVFYASGLLTLFYISLFEKFYTNKEQNNKNIYWLILFALISLNILLTGSRSGIIAIGIGMLYIMYKLTSLRKKINILFVSLIICTIGFSLNLMLTDNNKISQESEISGSSIEMRLVQWEGTLELLDPHLILFGLGHGWITEYLNEYGPHPILLGFESLLFSGMIQYGIIGFILIYGTLFFGLYKLNKFVFKNNNILGEERHILNGFLLSYIIYAFMTGPLYIIFFLGCYIFLLKAITLYNQNE